MSASIPAPLAGTNAAILQTFAINEKVNQFLLSNINDVAWRTAPPGRGGRTIAELFVHIHNVRLMWLKVGAKDQAVPEKLDPPACTRAQAASALSESARACSHLIESALATTGKIKNFKPDAIHFVAYLNAHEAHHRGQIAQLARQTGYPLPKNAGYAMWEWGTLAKGL